MNPGVVEEGGKVATGIVDALKSTPMTMAMILTNICLLVYLFFSQSAFLSQRQEFNQVFLENERQLRDILARCVLQ